MNDFKDEMNDFRFELIKLYFGLIYSGVFSLMLFKTLLPAAL